MTRIVPSCSRARRACLAALAATLLCVARPAAGEEGAVEVHGFGETLTTARVVSNPTQPSDFVRAEARLALELDHASRYERLQLRLDVSADPVRDAIALDLRTASITTAPTTWLELVIGRQALTWGTGDLIFLNDVFPKDYVSFFSGRAPAFLKVPSTALRARVFAGPLELDLVWIPVFEPDRSITGRTLSYFSRDAGEIVGADAAYSAARPDVTLKNGVGAMRASAWAGAWELAAYAHVGFTTQPLAAQPSSGAPTYARRISGGASVRVSVGRALLNLEGVYHHNPDDARGDDPTQPNREARALLGLERELASNLTLGLQYLAELTLNHGALRANAPVPAWEPNEVEHVASLRLTGRLLRDELTLSLFAIGSPTRGDLYVAPSLDWRATDALRVSLGANVMAGEHTHTLFGQLRDDTNVWARARYTF